MADPLLEVTGLYKSFDGATAVDNVSFTVSESETLGIVGESGSGKTTLMNIIAGNIQVDKGTIHRQQHLRISQLHQNLAETMQATVYEVVKHGLNHQLSLIAQFEMLANQVELDSKQLHTMEKLQNEIDSGSGWQVDQQTELSLIHISEPTRQAEIS